METTDTELVEIRDRRTTIEQVEDEVITPEVQDAETGESIIIERTRQSFSFTASELRQRNNVTKEKVSTSSSNTDESNGGGSYECNICFDTAIHPVLTLCGHLFCWSCLAQWLNTTSRNPTCPVCKAGCGKDKVIPIYGRGKEEIDPRNDPSIPTRPSGQRPPPIHDPNRPATSFFGQPFGSHTFNRGGVSISGGFGFFPFGFAFNIPMNSNPQNPQGTFTSRLIMMLVTLFVVVILFA